MNRSIALQIAQRLGSKILGRLLRDAHKDLEKRLKAAAKRSGQSTFTATQLRSTMAQIEDVTKGLVGGMKDPILAASEHAAQAASHHAVEYLKAADNAFRGVGSQPLRLREASLLHQGVAGARSTVLRRLVEGPEGRGEKAKRGILHRYGSETLGHFEGTLRRGMIAKKSVQEVADDLREDSPFLKGAPAHWARRIAVTETLGASNRATHEVHKEANEQLGGDMVRVLSCVQDDRTGADSLAVQGQVRKMDEPFASWFGDFMTPPDRPFDRAVVIAHRRRWPLPPYLQPLPWDVVVARWKMEGRKGSPPPRPLMSTVAGIGDTS